MLPILHRRSFLASAAAALARRHVPLSALGTPVGKLNRIGIELYAVRGAMKANPEKTLEALAKIGYTDVELLWSFKNFGQSIKEVKASLEATGLKAPSAHMAPDTILTEWEQRCAEVKELGMTYLIAPGLPSEANRSIEAVKLWATRFNNAGEVARRYGLWIALHNEPNHEKPVMGQKPIEVFLAETDPKLVRFQLDVGNMLMGGGDPLDFLQRHRARCWSFHLKNVIADRTKDTELARGVFDLKTFLSAVPELDKKPCFVEQEGSGDELVSAKENLEYLRGLTW
ncbi:sugar phosphate isomerase/epimerase family protein [Gemmatimonas sp.]|jgi:sugar phosphate isomerase/epimerase|uniref:sugar phosphate isomerase/epimerase family protein n=2 Tax=Gemmatimonas sp. TaxID=1962908 RepID=UPI0025C17103|nr:sugar phosphate isomerase/epimerase [Gemmatimonas sp.]MCA2984213.1 sugar phosphate isomerase/epimerase [Gemmatimonas sp.]MCA2995176.1 sugar phosphate isomerase/epimerase [Gemmatimonas sp.]